MAPESVEMNKRAMRFVYDRLGVRENLYLTSYFNALAHCHRWDHEAQKLLAKGVKGFVRTHREKFPLWEEELAGTARK